MKIERSKAWWMSRIEREGDGPVEAGSLFASTVPGGVGDRGLDPFPDDARVRALVPLRLVLVAFKDGDRWAGEIHGYTTDVDTGKPTRIRTRGWFADDPTAEDLHGLATTWFDHELREQLGMKPHEPKIAISDIHGEAWKDRHARVQELQGQLAAVERERDDYARLVEVWRKRSDSKADRIAELEATLNGLCEHTLTAINRLTTLGYYGSASVLNEARNQACAVLSPSPIPSTATAPVPEVSDTAQPATAAKQECAGCAKVARYPGEGYVCIMHYDAPAAPPSLAAREATTLVEFAQRVSDDATFTDNDMYLVNGEKMRAMMDALAAHYDSEAVISSNRPTPTVEQAGAMFNEYDLMMSVIEAARENGCCMSSECDGRHWKPLRDARNDEGADVSAKIDTSLLPQWLPDFDPGFERCRGCGAERRKPSFVGDENPRLVYEEVHDPECPYP